MVVYPELLRTWLIGDGYFMGASNDPYYIGTAVGSFYMNTDIGYLRLIFYCGTIGLATFIAFFMRCVHYCCEDFPTSKLAFWALLALNLIVWFKVATDIFVVFAILLMIKTVNDNVDQPDDLPEEEEGSPDAPSFIVDNFTHRT